MEYLVKREVIEKLNALANSPGTNAFGRYYMKQAIKEVKKMKPADIDGDLLMNIAMEDDGR